MQVGANHRAGAALNYRHAFHAGNFADVFKHALLTRMLIYLTRKETPLRYIDTHAGLGQYDFSGEEAQRGGEWRDGVGRVAKADMPADVRELLAPWLDIARLTPDAEPFEYPGSPLIAQALLRPIDRMVVCELHDRDQPRLVRNLGRDKRVKALHMDGYMALNASVPPPERRGLVLVDPPFEDRAEFDAMAQAVIRAWKKWPTGVYALWYPLKRPAEAEDFGAGLVEAGLKRMLRLEIDIATWREIGPLTGCGLIVVNPPFALEAEARVMLPWMTKTLARDTGARWRVDWLAGE